MLCFHSQKHQAKNSTFMAVEAQITNFMNTHQGNHILFNTQMGIPCSKTMHESNGFPLFYDSVSEKNMKISDSGVCFNLPNTSKKRTRDTLNGVNDSDYVPLKFGNSSFFNENIHLQRPVLKSEIDRMISQQTEKLKMELEKQMRRQTQMLVSAVHGGVMKKLKEKDEEIQKSVKTNWILQQRVKNMFLENQLWKDLAQNNEGTINTLKTNLVQAMTHVSKQRLSCAGDDVADDAESCCESYDVVGEGEVMGCRLVDGVKDKVAHVSCRKCGEKESSVMLLPCRHLCLCTLCGSTAYSCPLCNCHITTALHVEMS